MKAGSSVGRTRRARSRAGGLRLTSPGTSLCARSLDGLLLYSEKARRKSIIQFLQCTITAGAATSLTLSLDI